MIDLTLLVTYPVMGHGLGASGVFTQATASLLGDTGLAMTFRISPVGRRS